MKDTETILKPCPFAEMTHQCSDTWTKREARIMAAILSNALTLHAARL